MHIRVLVFFGLFVHILLNVLILYRLDYRVSWYTSIDIFAVFVAIYFTDFITGLIHWIGDVEVEWNWALLRRFHELSQTHHRHPLEILQHGFFDIKGNIAFLYAPPLITAVIIAPVTELSPLVFFCLTLSNLMLAAHSIHKWCHQKTVHPLVAWLQRTGIIVSRQYHLQHHVPPYASNFAALNGWSDSLLRILLRGAAQK